MFNVLDNIKYNFILKKGKEIKIKEVFGNGNMYY